MLKKLLIISSILFLISCSSDAIPEGSELLPKLSDYTDLQQTAILIDLEVDDAAASNLNSCDMIPIGAKPCGGPWGYLVFSKEISDKKSLEELAETYTELDHIRNIEEGRISTCEITGAPTLQIKEGSCHGTYGSAWNPGDVLWWAGIEVD